MNSKNPPRKSVISKFKAGPIAPLTEVMRLFQTGKIKPAEKLVEKFIKANPGHPDALHLMGLILFNQGQAVKSANYIAKAIAAGGESNPAFQANHGLALKTAGKLPESLIAYNKALAIDATNPGWWNDRGNVLSQQGLLAEAEGSYRRSLELTSRDAKTWVNLGSVLVKQGKFSEAIASTRKAVEISPQMAQTHNGLGNALHLSGKVPEAINSFETALKLDAQYGEAIGNLAVCFEEINKIDKARDLIEKSRLKLKDNAHLALVLAKCDRRDGNLEQATKLLESINRKKQPVPLHRDIAFELSRLYDRLGRHAEAFAAMGEGNQKMLISEGVDETYGDSFIDLLGRLKDWHTPEKNQIISKEAFRDVEDGEVDPVFLVGFPRSGTTLLGQVLDGHSALVMVEERPMLDTLVARIRKDLGGYPEGLDKLTPENIADLRGLYFEGADQEIKRLPGQVIIDKFPLHLIHIGFILKVFPKARFIFALRHPCDAVLSCFMQSFTPNPAMANFFSTPRAAMTYDRVMSLWQQYETIYAPKYHAIRYEDVVADFDGEVGKLLTFLGLKWEDGVRDYAENARAKGHINTPSYHQVTEAIYTRARYRWLRYESELKPIMETLNPWIKSFGYDD